MDAAFCLESIHLYPLKSGAGIAVGTARLESEGLADDRRMMVVDEAGDCITARKVPRLMQIRTHVDGDEVILAAPDTLPLVFSRRGLDRIDPVSIWGDDVLAHDAGDAAAQWLSRFLGVASRLALKGEKTHRALAFKADATVSFADTAPLLLTSAASLADLNRFLETPAEMERFRPNLVVTGATPYDEDSWGVVRIGGVEFDVAGGCDRCVMVTLDPLTGEKRVDHEPLAMLGRQRRGDDGKPYFGQFLVPRTLGRLHVGDRVEVISRKPPLSVGHGTAEPVTRLPTAAGSRPRPSARNRERLLRCVAVIDEAADFRTFRFVTESGEPIDYLPGQFMTFLLDVDGETVRRNYTISSSPSRPHHVSVTVKRVPGGLVSNWLHDTLAVGDTIRSLGPNGRFHLAAAGSAKQLLMLSAGSGVTPMMAMLRFIADTDLPLDVRFHHSIRNISDMAFLEELLLLQGQMAGRLRLSWNLTAADGERQARAFSRSHQAAAGKVSVAPGRLDDVSLAHVCPDLAGRVVLCCGPDGFRARARELLASWQPAPPYAFLEETFGPDRSAPPLPEIGAYAVSFERSGRRVVGEGTVTLLELAHKAGVAVASDCEAGVCGTCRCKVVSGTWRLASNAADAERSALSDIEKRDGYVLACSTNPVGDVVLDL